jgi:uncharacterized cupredoxin-like copper-binding protein
MPKPWRGLLPFALLLAACATPADDSLSDSKIGYVNAGAAASADWTNPVTVKVMLADFKFEPDHLSLEAGKAYRLDLENKSGSTHYFAAEDFFKAVVTEKLVKDGTSVDRPLLKAVALAPGETKELLIVPVRKGTYALQCTAPFHKALGMSGTIEIT